MEQVVEGVYRIPLGVVNSFVVADGARGLVLVDPGPPGSAGTMETELATVGRTLSEAHTVLVTHRHVDTVGSLAEIRRRSGATVVMHQLDGTVVNGSAKAPRPGFVAGLTGVFGPRAERADVDVLLTAELTDPLCDGFVAVHTPGHTAGHTAFLLDRAGGVLFTGDALRNVKGRAQLPQKSTSEDLAVAEMSVRRMSELTFEVACFGRGDPVVSGARQLLHDCLAEVSAW